MLTFPNKKIRAEVIKEYLQGTTYKGVVCFSCGNASRALKEVGLDVVDISPSGSLTANKWWTPAEIQRTWPDRFDATSGHLTVALMEKIGAAYRAYLGRLDCDDIHGIPCGSGETFCCVQLAYPDMHFDAVYDNSKPETTYNAYAPLNNLVKILAGEVIMRHN